MVIMKTLKKLFGIKTTYAIPSDNGVDITKGKKYVFTPHKQIELLGSIKDNTGVQLFIQTKCCNHINGGSWQIITE